MKRPSEVPPVVDSSGSQPVTSTTACTTASESWPGGVKNGSPDTNHSSEYLTPCRSRIAVTVRCSFSTVCSVEKRRLKRARSSPGITFGAPVPAAMFDIWKVVG